MSKRHTGPRARLCLIPSAGLCPSVHTVGWLQQVQNHANSSTRQIIATRVRQRDPKHTSYMKMWGWACRPGDSSSTCWSKWLHFKMNICLQTQTQEMSKGLKHDESELLLIAANWICLGSRQAKTKSSSKTWTLPLVAGSSTGQTTPPPCKQMGHGPK